MNALDVLGAGLAVLPIDPRTKKTPTNASETYPFPRHHGYAWKAFQTVLPTERQVRAFLDLYPGCWLGIACGEGSGGLEVLDFDIPGKGSFAPGQRGSAPAWKPWCEGVRAAGLGSLLSRLVVVETRSGGRQVYYRCSQAARNSKLADRPPTREELERDPKARPQGLIETRGAGGLVVCPPSEGYRFVQGGFASIPFVTDEERGALWAVACALDESPPEPPRPPAPSRPRPEGDVRPGDAFDAQASWEEILEPHGYRKVGRAFGGGMQLWAHPAKARGDWSARTGVGHVGDRFYSWSCNGGVPPNRLLTRFGLYAHLNHAGDFEAAARALGVRGYGTPARRREPRTSAGDREDDLENLANTLEDSPLGLPSIQWNGRQLPHVTADAIGALVASNDPRHLFDRGGKVVRVVEDKDGGFKIENLGAAAMRNEIGKAANWTRLNDRGRQVPGYVPKEVAENVLAERGLAKAFPRLEGLSSVPVLSASGDFFRDHGYDPESGFYITGRGPFPAFDGDGAAAARYLLRELFHDFPFVDDGGASRANALALALLPYVRPIVDGPTPMHYVEAPQSRTGKSLLVEVALLPSLGKKGVSSTPLPEKEEELNKALAGMIFEGDQLVFLDNVKRRVNSASLEQLLTAHMLRFRPLGSTASVVVPVKPIFAMTSNNGTMSTDMAGRCVLIRIDARMERPEDRAAFRHEDIRAFIEESRPTIRAACMAMVDHWVRAGRPRGPRRKASYVQWAQTIGGILEACGVEGFLANDKTLKGTAADEDEPWRDFYEAWWGRFGDRLVTGPELLRFAKEGQLLGGVLEGKSDRSDATAFGKAMAAREGKVLDGRRQEAPRNAEGRPHKKDGQKTFRLVAVDGSASPSIDGQAGLVFDAAEVDPFEFE